MVTGTGGGPDTLVQIAPSRIPGQAANAMQAMKMAQALNAAGGLAALIAARGNGAVDAAALARQFGVDILPNMLLLPLRGRYGIHLFNLRAALAARRLGVGLVVSRSVGAAALAARMGLPTVFECHAPPQGFERRYWRFLARAPAFRRLVVISDALRGLMREAHPETEAMDVVVAHDGVDLARFEDLPAPAAAKRAAGLDPDRPVAGYAGHLYRGRGIDVILAAASRLPGWDFVIAGGTDADVAALRAEVGTRGFGNVSAWGHVPNADLAARLAVCDVLLMPYQPSVMVSGGRLDTARWMSPLKMFEYMAMGRAIVSSDLPVLREVLDDDIARLVPPADEDGWVAALTALEDSAERERLAAAARARAAGYEWSARCARMLDGLWPAGREMLCRR
jgi:glycosyltransferase involved in cell wall biosynthesis